MKKIVFIALCLLSLNSILIQTIFKDNDTFKNLVRAIVVVIVIAGIVLIKKQLNKRLLFFIMVASFFMIVGRNTDEITFIFIFIVIQGMIDLDDRYVEKYMAIASVIPVLVMLLFLLVGITHNSIVKDTTFQIRSRMTFGLPGDRVPYVFDIVYGALATFYIYAYNNFTKIKKSIVFIFCLVIGSYFFIKTDTRGGYTALIILLILSILLPRISKLKLIKRIIKILPIMFAGFIIVLYIGRNNMAFNKMFSLRPFLTGEFLNSIPLWKIIMSTSVKAYMQSTIIDNTYIHLIIGGGIILSILMFRMYVKAIDALFYKKKFIEVAFIISMLFYFNVESIGIRPENVFSILCWYLIFKYGLLKHQFIRRDNNDSVCDSNI